MIESYGDTRRIMSNNVSHPYWITKAPQTLASSMLFSLLLVELHYFNYSYVFQQWGYILRNVSLGVFFFFLSLSECDILWTKMVTEFWGCNLTRPPLCIWSVIDICFFPEFNLILISLCGPLNLKFKSSKLLLFSFYYSFCFYRWSHLYHGSPVINLVCWQR